MTKPSYEELQISVEERERIANEMLVKHGFSGNTVPVWKTNAAIVKAVKEALATFQQSSSLVSQGAESADIGKLDTADESAERFEKALRDIVDERFTELDMMRCEFHSDEAIAVDAWHAGVSAAWKQFDLVKQIAKRALEEGAKSGVEMGKVNRGDEMTKRCDYVSKFIPNRICTLDDGHIGAHHCVAADCGGNCGEKSCQICNPAGSAETGGEKAPPLPNLSDHCGEKVCTIGPDHSLEAAWQLATRGLGSGESREWRLKDGTILRISMPSATAIVNVQTGAVPAPTKATDSEKTKKDSKAASPELLPTQLPKEK